MKRLLVTVLSMEAVVVLLAIVPAKQLGHVSGGHGGRGLRRHRGRRARALRLCRPGPWRAVRRARCSRPLVIASGVLLSAMYILGAIFAALWFTGIWLGRKWERDEVRPA